MWLVLFVKTTRPAGGLSQGAVPCPTSAPHPAEGRVFFSCSSWPLPGSPEQCHVARKRLLQLPLPPVPAYLAKEHLPQSAVEGEPPAQRLKGRPTQPPGGHQARGWHSHCPSPPGQGSTKSSESHLPLASPPLPCLLSWPSHLLPCCCPFLLVPPAPSPCSALICFFCPFPGSSLPFFVPYLLSLHLYLARGSLIHALLVNT